MSESAMPPMDAALLPAQVGSRLAAAREAQGLSVADVARQLKLSATQVQSMEAGEYHRLPGAVFVRGFIRNYARLVKLDSVPLLASPEPPVPPVEAAAPASPVVDIPFPGARQFAWHKYALFGLLLLAVIAGYEFYEWDGAAPPIGAPPAGVELPRSQAERGEAGVMLAALSSQQAAHGESAPEIRTADSVQDKMNDKEAPGRGSARREPAAGEHLLKLRFERESWVEIRDRDGRKILSQLNHAGTEQSVSGLPPFTLVVGNAAGVKLMHNDQRVDLAPHIKIDVARLTLE